MSQAVKTLRVSKSPLHIKRRSTGSVLTAGRPEEAPPRQGGGALGAPTVRVLNEHQIEHIVSMLHSVVASQAVSVAHTSFHTEAHTRRG